LTSKLGIIKSRNSKKNSMKWQQCQKAIFDWSTVRILRYLGAKPWKMRKDKLMVMKRQQRIKIQPGRSK
jgi:hypothetical protein